MPYHYQDRASQAEAIERAHQWLDRLVQLAHFETIVLRPPAGRRDRPERAGDAGERVRYHAGGEPI